MIIGIKIHIQMLQFHPFVQGEITIAFAAGRRLGGNNRKGVIRMRRQPIDFLRQDTLHATRIVEVRDAIEDFHCVTSFRFQSLLRRLTISV